MTSLQVDYEDRALWRMKGALSDRELGKAQASVLNRVMAKTRTLTNRAIRQRIAVKARDVNAQMRVIRANPARIQTTLTVSGARIPLRKFPHSVSRRGVSVRIRPKGGRTRLKSAFIGPNNQIFQRTSRRRLPIAKLTGPSIPRTMAEKIIERQQMDLIKREYPQDMVRELRFRISKASGR